MLFRNKFAIRANGPANESISVDTKLATEEKVSMGETPVVDRQSDEDEHEKRVKRLSAEIIEEGAAWQAKNMGNIKGLRTHDHTKELSTIPHARQTRKIGSRRSARLWELQL